tara:strand:+ start:126 stop:869 length:744 start_codon:yes stop_codon:yes gene_type:complete
MSEEKTESVDAPESTTEETTSQNEQQQQPEFDKDKFFRGAYNEGKSKVERDMISKFSEILGNDVNTLDDAFSLLSNKMQPVQSDAGEEDKLRELLQQAQVEAEAAKEQLALSQMETKIGSEFQGAFNALEQDNELTLKKNYIEQLFYNEYEIEESNGQFYATKNGVPDLDAQGNRKSVGNSLVEFAKQFAKPKKVGTGGATGGTPSTDRPSRAEFQKLVRSSSPADRSKAEQLYAAKKQAGGWAEEA